MSAPATITSTLGNGVRVVTRTMPWLESASIGVWVDAGCRDEQPEQNGIAHFLEHMAFKGTTGRSALQIAEAIEDVGGFINAYTARDVTAYYARVLSADTGLALDIISDILLHSVFDQREIEVERGVILQEIGQTLDTPDDVIFDWLQEAAYPDQALGRSILGPAERVAHFGRPDLARFVAEHYGPGQMVVAAAGAVDHDRVRAQAEAALGHLPPLPARRRQPASWAGAERREVRQLEQAHFALALPGPSYLDDDYFTTQLWAGALGGGMSSRLFQKLREERGLCYSIFAQASFHEDTGMLTLYAGTSGEDLGQLMRLVVDEVKRAAEDLTEAELARAKTQLRAGILMSLERPTAQAERIARSLAIWGRVPDTAESVARIDAVTLAGVRAHAARQIASARPAMALTGPVAGAPGLDDVARWLVA